MVTKPIVRFFLFTFFNPAQNKKDSCIYWTMSPWKRITIEHKTKYCAGLWAYSTLVFALLSAYLKFAEFHNHEHMIQWIFVWIAHIRVECYLSGKEDRKPLGTFLDNRDTSKKTLNTFLPGRDFQAIFSLHPNITNVRCGFKRINRSNLV